MGEKNIPNGNNYLNINDESLINDYKKSQDSINPKNASDYEDDELDTANIAEDEDELDTTNASDYEDEELDTANVKIDYIDNNINLNNLNSNLINQFIKIIDIDDLTPDELLRILVAVGSKNMAYYLALIVNLENRSRKISPLGIAKILSSKSVNAPSSNPEKTSSAIKKMTPSENFNNIP